MQTQIKDGKIFADIKDLSNWSGNPRSIKDKDFGRLKKQITELGQHTPILVDKDGVVYGGNMRVRAYRDLGISEVWVSLIEGDEAKKLEYALSSNDRAGFYDADLLANLIPDYPDFNWEDYAVDLKEPQLLSELIDKFTETEEDEVPEVSTDPAISELGKVYQLGRHRLMCGDATKIEDVELLMNGQKAEVLYTDPPYGMNLNTNYDDMFKNDTTHKDTGERFDKVIADNKYFDPTFLVDLTKEVFLWGADYFYDSLPRGGSWSSWDKRTEILDDVIGNTTEFLWSKVPHRRMTARVLWSGYHGMGKDDDKERTHPTQKPIGLHKWFFDNYGNNFKSVLDLFGGSGSTLIACEQTNRTCYMMELDPRYVDVIRKRYAKLSGKEQEWQTLTPEISL